MKIQPTKLIFFFTIIVLCSPPVFGQVEILERADRNRQAIEARNRQEQRDRKIEHMENMERMLGGTSSSSQSIKIVFNLGSEFKTQLSKVTERDKELLAISAEDKNNFQNVLKANDSGMFRLFDVSECEDSKIQQNETQECPNSVWSRGTAFSFRDAKYFPGMFSDVVLRSGVIGVESALSLGIVGELDQDPKMSATLNSPGVDKVIEFEPTEKLAELSAMRKLIHNGVLVDGKLYRDRMELKEGQNYILRNIAFRHKYLEEVREIPVQGSRMNFRNRKDITVIFRAVRLNKDKSWLIVWRTLQEKRSPLLDTK